MSPAAGAREIDRADKSDRNQKNDGGKKSKDNQDHLLKTKGELQAAHQRYTLCFLWVTLGEMCMEVAKNGQVWAVARSSRVLELPRSNRSD
jgi:hypothetical protein